MTGNHEIRAGSRIREARENNVVRHSTPLRVHVPKLENGMHRSASDYNQSKKDDGGNVISQQ